MTHEHTSAWINCILSSTAFYLAVLDAENPAIVQGLAGQGWTKTKANEMIIKLAEKANKLAGTLTSPLFPAPIASTALCISRMMSMGIKFENAITASIMKIEKA